MKFKEKFQRFWMGRNGPDQLYQTLMWIGLILLVVNMLIPNPIVRLLMHLLIIGIFIYATFRCLSKNYYKRQRENQAFLNFWRRIGNWFKLQKNRFRDRKTHIYRKCPACKKMLRLPKIKGRHTVCCPCCSFHFSINV